jgi:hypothetical protein
MSPVLGSRVSGGSQCRVAAFSVSGLLELAFFFITISHCAWRHVISLSKATKKRSKENAFRTRAHKLTQRAVSTFLAPQKHGARQNGGCVKPSFSEHGYPHASPPVTEPAQGASRAIRVNHPPNLYAYRTTSPTHSKQGCKDILALTPEPRICYLAFPAVPLATERAMCAAAPR